MGEKNSTYCVLVGNPEGKGQLARLLHRLENYINMNREEIGLEGGYWFRQAQSDEKCTYNNDT
jgi:hypothetical protein